MFGDKYILALSVSAVSKCTAMPRALSIDDAFMCKLLKYDTKN